MYDFTLDHIEPVSVRPDRMHVYLRAHGDQYGFKDGALYMVRSVTREVAEWFEHQQGVISLSEPDGIPRELLGRSIMLVDEDGG